MRAEAGEVNQMNYGSEGKGWLAHKTPVKPGDHLLSAPNLEWNFTGMNVYSEGLEMA